MVRQIGLSRGGQPAVLIILAGSRHRPFLAVLRAARKWLFSRVCTVDGLRLRVVTLACTVLAGLTLAACSGGVSSTNTQSASSTYSVGGTVAGLKGAGLVLQNNGADNLSVSVNGTFTFSASLITGDSYQVSVWTNPISPYQTCVVTHGGGTVTSAQITGIVVTCTDKTTITDTVGGMAVGVRGSGLTLQNNGGDTLAVAASGAFTFATPLASGVAYSVTVLSPPIDPYQDCAVTNGSGTTGGNNITNVAILCTTNSNPAYTIGGTVSGISPATPLTIEDNGRDPLTLSTNGPFTFRIPIPSGSVYNVTSVATAGLESQACTFTNAGGTVQGADVKSVSITCVANVSIGVTVSGLVGTGLVLQANAADNLAVAKNASYTFGTPLVAGSTYNVTALSQPVSPFQTCAVNDGAGTAISGLAPVTVTCTTTPTFSIGGNLARYDTPAPVGLVLANGQDMITPPPYATTFTFQTPVASGQPYAVSIERQPAGQSCQLSNASGIVGMTAVISVQVNCTWWVPTGVGGENGGAGVYGVKGMAAAANLPGARQGAMTWTDSAGNFWMYGGYGFDSSAALGRLSDLWQYSPTTGEWTWINGASTIGIVSTYGTPGVPSALNVPGGRNSAVSWIDNAGNLWMFGGYGVTVGGDGGSRGADLNDLWRYDPRANEWTWMSGGTTGDLPGVYGTQNVAAASNLPGARDSGVSWIDKSGNLWLFGGSGYANTAGLLNDLWEYSPASNLWTWIGGSNSSYAPGVYGAPSPDSDVPGGREMAVSWTDRSGNFWLFGGEATYLVNGDTITSLANDLWQYTPTTRVWTHISGATTGAAPGVYGSQGVPAANAPGARAEATSWLDTAGNLWLFGGTVTFLIDGKVETNLGDDVWEYSPATRLWTWVEGADVCCEFTTAVLQSPGVPVGGDDPGARSYAMSWRDLSGNLWLFGGYPANESPNVAELYNDLWKFVPFNVAP
jgi:hypothetical protein